MEHTKQEDVPDTKLHVISFFNSKDNYQNQIKIEHLCMCIHDSAKNKFAKKNLKNSTVVVLKI